MLSRLTTGMAFALALLSAPALAQTDPPVPPPVTDTDIVPTPPAATDDAQPQPPIGDAMMPTVEGEPASPDASVVTAPEGAGNAMPLALGDATDALPAGHPPIDALPAGHPPIVGMTDGHHDKMRMQPSSRTMIRLSVGKDRTLEVACGEDNIAACVAAVTPILDRFID